MPHGASVLLRNQQITFTKITLSSLLKSNIITVINNALLFPEVTSVTYYFLQCKWHVMHHITSYFQK